VPWLLAVAAACALAVPGPAAAAPVDEALPRLDVVRGSDPAIVDVTGRQVLLRGVNANNLGDYHQRDPTLPTVLPLDEADFAAMAALGFDVVRLVLSWSELEPEPGAFDQGYVARIRQAVQAAERHGLYTVLDMHQDAWSARATPADETCPPGLAPAIGWDGAPAWADRFDGLTTCRRDRRELSPAVAQAFTNWLVDRDGIQTALVRTWGRLAREFAAEPAVAGYDLFNEPHPGYAPVATAVTLLGRYYDRAIDAVRVAEASVPGGFPHPVFFEPTVLWSGLGVDGTPPPGFTDDPRLVFAPHLYAESISLDQGAGATVVTVEDGFRLAQAVAATYGAPLWSGEWGWYGDPAVDAEKVRRYAAAEDDARIGGAWWSWEQACGDPHQLDSSVQTGITTGVSPSLRRFSCPDGAALGVPDQFRLPLSRAYPRAVPGRLTSLSSDVDSGALALAGTAGGGSCRLDLWVPDRGTGAPTVTATGVEGVGVRAVEGGFRVDGCATGDYTVVTASAGPVPASAPGSPTSAPPAAARGRGLPATGPAAAPTGLAVLLLAAAAGAWRRRVAT
jgi:endoglycosylceramidase